MIFQIKYWFKRITGIRVRNEGELRNAIEKVHGTKRAIIILDSISITKSLVIHPDITIFVFYPIKITNNVSLFVGNK